MPRTQRIRFPNRRVVAQSKANGATESGSNASKIAFALRGLQTGGINRLSENQDPNEQVKFFKHWIYAAVKARSQAIAQTKLRFFVVSPNGDKKELEPSDSGPGRVGTLFRDPNPHQSAWQFFYLNEVFLDLTGDCYIYKQKNRMGRIVNLWTLYPQYVTIEVAEDGQPKYIYQRGSERAVFNADEIAHGRFPDPQSEWYGVSPLQAATQAVNVHEAIFESQQQAFEQGIEPTAILTVPEDAEALTPEQIERTERELYSKHQGKKRHGKVAMIEGGAKLSPWSMSPREMNWIESAGLSMNQILGIYGVPAAIAGLSEDVNRSSAEAMEFIFAKWTVEPLLRQWEDLLNRFIIQSFDTRIVAQFDSVIPQDKDAEVERVVKLAKAAIITSNEGRDVVDIEPFMNAAADELYTDFNRVPLGATAAAAEDDSKALVAPVVEKQDDPARGVDPDDLVGGVDWKKEAEIMADVSQPHLARAYAGGWKAESTLAGTEAIPELFDANVSTYLRGKNPAYFNQMLEDTRKAIVNTLAEGLENGETLRQLEQRIDKLYDFQETARSERIARTESADAQNSAGQSNREAFGVPFKEWIATFQNTRDTHASADGQIVANAKKFNVGGVMMERPADLSAPAGETVNCQCVAAGTFEEKGWPEAARKAYWDICMKIQEAEAAPYTLTLSKYFKRQGILVRQDLRRLGEGN